MEGDGRRGARKPAVMPSRFDGTGDLEEFLAHFDLCVLANGWSEVESGTFLGISLAGVARRLLANVKPASAAGYHALRLALVDRFQPQSQVESYKALLRTRIRKPDEELQNLAEEVTRLVRLSYPNADAGTIDTIAKDKFVECLDDTELRHWIYQGEPKNLSAAVQRGVQAEAYLKSERSKVEKVRGSTKTMAEEMESVKGWMVEINKKLENKVPAATETATSAGGLPRSGSCFDCGSNTHYKRQCPQWLAKKEKYGSTGKPAPATPSGN